MARVSAKSLNLKVCPETDPAGLDKLSLDIPVTEFVSQMRCSIQWAFQSPPGPWEGPLRGRPGAVVPGALPVAEKHR